MRALLLLAVGCADPVERTVVVVTLDRTETTSTTTDPPPSDRRAPRIEEMRITELPGEIEVRLELVAGGASVSGGVVSVALDGEVYTLGIPEDLRSFRAGVAEFTVDRPRVGQCARGADHELVVEVVDSSGQASKTESARFTTTDVGVVLDELGGTTLPVLGVWESGGLVCGALDSTGNDGVTYTADRDLVGFTIDPGGLWSLTLGWEVAGDYDLWLYGVDPIGGLVPIDDAAHPGDAGPEVVARYLSDSQQYAAEVVGWSGAAGAWTLTLE